MERIVNHPILTIPQEGEHTFLFNGKPVTGMKGFTIAAALHQAGYPVQRKWPQPFVELRYR